jgi:methylated-DNA-[protein]-cysteine S-methyltransferase
MMTDPMTTPRGPVEPLIPRDALATVASPLGVLRLVATAEGLSGIFFPDHRGAAIAPAHMASEHPVLGLAVEQLAEYFAGHRDRFTIPLAPRGTPFQHRVWRALATIPYGETRSYGQIARQIGSPPAVRAVGAANGKNPLSIVVPCHRVIGADGKLTGFGGGLDAKRWLLDHERRYRA